MIAAEVAGPRVILTFSQPLIALPLTAGAGPWSIDSGTITGRQTVGVTEVRVNFTDGPPTQITYSPPAFDLVTQFSFVAVQGFSIRLPFR